MFGNDKATKLCRILRDVRKLLILSEESLWSPLTPGEVVAILDKEVGAFETTGKMIDSVELVSLFAPTADIQEISIANSWGEQYLSLAGDFDSAVLEFPEDAERIRSKG